MAESLGEQKAGTLTSSFEVPFGTHPVKQAVSRVLLFNSEGGLYDTPDEGFSAIARVEKEKAAAHTVPPGKDGNRQGQREYSASAHGRKAPWCTACQGRAAQNSRRVKEEARHRKGSDFDSSTGWCV